jgi:hypothetical protein
MDEIWRHIATTCIGIIVSGLSFWFIIAKNMVTKEEVKHWIETTSPYVHDKSFIMEKLATHKENQKQFADALQRNTEVMVELKTQIAVLGETLKALEKRIEK